MVNQLLQVLPAQVRKVSVLVPAHQNDLGCSRELLEDPETFPVWPLAEAIYFFLRLEPLPWWRSWYSKRRAKFELLQALYGFFAAFVARTEPNDDTRCITEDFRHLLHLSVPFASIVLSDGQCVDPKPTISAHVASMTEEPPKILRQQAYMTIQLYLVAFVGGNRRSPRIRHGLIRDLLGNIDNASSAANWLSRIIAFSFDDAYQSYLFGSKRLASC